MSPWSGEAAVQLGDSARLALMLTPQSRGSFARQAEELIGALVGASKARAMEPTALTVFLRRDSDRAAFERLLARAFDGRHPVTSFVLQPPCCGAAVALEAWCVGGPGVRIERFGSRTIAVSYDSVRWVHCAGVEVPHWDGGAREQTVEGLRRLKGVLAAAGGDCREVVRTWFFLGGITEPEDKSQRYKELNRGRAEFYSSIRFKGTVGCRPHLVYPASTGIGMGGRGLVLGCVALQASRGDMDLFPLENPQQTPAYTYHRRYSPESPRFSRAMALVLADYTTVWVSGTASIVNSESLHPGDIEKQTRQTIDNIEKLIASGNFARHGRPRCGASLRDLAKIRVYVKREEDFARCRAVCEERFGTVPAIYAVADVCRPELLVEIEGIAFSRLAPAKPRPPG